MLQSQPFTMDRLHAHRERELTASAEHARTVRVLRADAPARAPRALRWRPGHLPHWLTGRLALSHHTVS